MAGGLSDYAEKTLIDLLLGKVAYSGAATTYLLLMQDQNTKAQRDAGTFTEVGGTSYARVTLTNNLTNWPAASGVDATKQNGTAGSFPSAGSNWGNVYALGIADDPTAGNLLAWVDLLAAEQPFTAADSGDVFTCYGHGYSNTNYVKVSAIPGASLPTGITEGAYYYIISATTNTFQLSLTSGGSAVALTSNGAGKVGLSQHVTINSGNIYTVAVNDITLTGD